MLCNISHCAANDSGVSYNFTNNDPEQTGCRTRQYFGFSAHGGCPSKQGMVIRVLLISINMVSMSGLLVIFGMTIRYRKEKLMKASSPSLLTLVLVGAAVSYLEVLSAAFPANRLTCMVTPWLHHLGFAVTYSALLAKIWRISAIMRVLKSRSLQARDSQLYKTVAITILVACLYLTLWSTIDPVAHSLTPNKWAVCDFAWWEVLIVAAEVSFLGWGGLLCYRARKAPDLYNESRSVALSIWNEAIWSIVYVFARFLLIRHPDIDMTFVLHFCRTQFTISVTILLIFVPKFRQLFSSVHTLHGTITDVYGGARRVHRISLAVDKGGSVRHIYCVPCGPLAYTEHEDDSEGFSDDDTRENQYTKGEVDTLIEMVSKLKSEKEHYKSQVKGLQQLLKEHRAKVINGFSLPINEEAIGDISRGTQGNLKCPYLMTTPCEENIRGDLSQGARVLHSWGSRKASTATTYLSMSPDNISLHTNEDDDNELLQKVLQDGKTIVHHPSLPNLQVYACASCAAASKRPQNVHCKTDPSTPADGSQFYEYPRLINDLDTNFNQADKVKSVSDNVGEMDSDQSKIEMEDFAQKSCGPPADKCLDTLSRLKRKCSHLHDRARPRRSKSCSDKMTFVMYI